RRGRSASTSAIKQQFGHGPSSGSEMETEHPPLATAPSFEQPRARTGATSAYCRRSFKAALCSPGGTVRLRPDGPTALASASHTQYDRTTAAPADGQIQRVRRRREAVDPAHGNPDLAIAEPLGHAREPATVRLHVAIFD